MTISLRELYNTQLKKYAEIPQIGIPWNINSKEVTKLNNPMCGDKIEIRISPKIIDNKFVIRRIYYECEGCALCKASAYILGEYSINCLEPDFDIMYDIINNIVNPKILEAENLDLIPFAYFRGVREYPQRAKCVLLP